MQSTRLVWADSLKGVLILLVVLGHAIQATMSDACEMNHLWNAIYSFHMAAFVAVSGYLAFHPAGTFLVSKSILRRFRQLVIPFLLWSLLSFLSYSGFSISAFIECILYPDRGFWFLWVLFFINAIFVMGSWLSEKTKIKQEWTILLISVLLVLIMVIFEPRLFGFQFISYYFLFYSLGYYLHKYENRVIRRNWYFIVPLTICWCALAWFWQMHELPSWLQDFPLSGTLMQYEYRFITATIAVYLICTVSPTLLNGDNTFNKPFVKLGGISLGIYTCHLIMIGRITESLRTLRLNETMLIVCSFLISLFASWLIVLLLSKWRYTAKYLLGKI